MNVLICPNAFKGSVSAGDAANAIAAGLKQSSLHADVFKMPIADGGDGSLVVLASQLNAKLINVVSLDPFGRRVNARYGWLASEKVAIIEMAEASGIQHLKKRELNPWQASSFGTGLIIKEALEKGAKKIWLTVGGSASVDGGVGILEALGCKFFSQDGRELHHIKPDQFRRIADIDFSLSLEFIESFEILVFCDVTNPLLGTEGAAVVFGPQKGASTSDLVELEKALKHLSDLCGRKTGKDISVVKHGGAAGGVSAFLHGFLNAQLLDGANAILDRLDFDNKLEWADVVITGEGCIDAQTMLGKAPGLAAARAKLSGKYVVGVCGQKGEIADSPFDEVLTINRDGDSLE